jgi:hypothetical protein
MRGLGCGLPAGVVLARPRGVRPRGGGRPAPNPTVGRRERAAAGDPAGLARRADAMPRAGDADSRGEGRGPTGPTPGCCCCCCCCCWACAWA